MTRDLLNGRSADASLLAGNAFPALPDTGDVFFRTDLGWWCYYDGTRWLTCFEYAVSVGNPDTATAADATLPGVRHRGDYAPFITRVSISSVVNSTNDGSKYWTVTLRGVNQAFTTTTTIWTYSTGTTPDAVGAWVDHSQGGALLTTQTPANYSWFSLRVVKTSTPGTVQVSATVHFRLIVT